MFNGEAYIGWRKRMKEDALQERLVCPVAVWNSCEIKRLIKWIKKKGGYWSIKVCSYMCFTMRSWCFMLDDLIKNCVLKLWVFVVDVACHLRTCKLLHAAWRWVYQNYSFLQNWYKHKIAASDTILLHYYSPYWFIWSKQIEIFSTIFPRKKYMLNLLIMQNQRLFNHFYSLEVLRFHCS